MMSPIEKRLNDLLASSPSRELSKNDKIVILSDLHLGDGGNLDDFNHNSSICLAALKNYYLPKGYTLILNGDIEELLRVPREAILKAWDEVYAVLAEFKANNRLVWLWGNHEILPQKGSTKQNMDYFDGEVLKLNYKENTLLIYHGHQAGTANSGRYNHLIGLSLRIFANNLGIQNKSVAHDSKKKFKIEKAVYEFSKKNKVLSIIGHTHRPLFESLSKYESINYQIETLCRRYASTTNELRRNKIHERILQLKADYLHTPHKDEHHLANSVYGNMLVPCLFNSGCGVGKRGMTTLEIKKGDILLVFWANRRYTERFSSYNPYKPARFITEDTFRYILKQESLDYIFARIKLLSD